MNNMQKWILVLLGLGVVSVLGLLVLLVLFISMPKDVNAQPPSVVIMSPPSGTTIALGQEVNVQIEARDDKGVTEIEFLVDGQPIAKTTSQDPNGQSSLTLNETWKPDAAAQYVLVGWASDAKGGTGNSQPVTIIVQETLEPTPATQPTVIVVVPTPSSDATPISPEHSKEEQIAPIWQQLAKDWAASDWPAAIRDIEQIMAIDPSYDDVHTKLYAAYVNYGNALLAQGDKQGAIREYKAALSVNPNGAAALQALRKLEPSPVTPTPTPTAQGSRPVGQIIAPPSNTQVGVGQTIDVSIVAHSPNGVTRVELWSDGGQVPYATLNNPNPKAQTWNVSFQWKSSVLGSHPLAVRAWDQVSNYGDSPFIYLQVVHNTGHPQVWITTPRDGDSFQLGQVVKIEGSATDEVGIIRMETWLDGRQWKYDTSSGQSPMYSSHKWQANEPGDHVIQIKVVDTANVTAKSNKITIHVEDSSGPHVQIDSPRNGATFNQGDQVTVQSTAVDNAAITKVELYVDSQLIRTDANPDPGQTSWIVQQPWAADQDGHHVLTTVAYDPQGKTGTSQPVAIIVGEPPQPPDISGIWHGQGSNYDFYLDIQQNDTVLNGTCIMDGIMVRTQGSLHDSSIVNTPDGDNLITISAQMEPALVNFRFDGNYSPDMGGHLDGNFTLSTGESGQIRFGPTGSIPPAPHPVPEPTQFVPTNTPTLMKPVPEPTQFYPTSTPTLMKPVPEPTQFYPTDTPMPPPTDTPLPPPTDTPPPPPTDTPLPPPTDTPPPPPTDTPLPPPPTDTPTPTPTEPLIGPGGLPPTGEPLIGPGGLPPEDQSN